MNPLHRILLMFTTINIVLLCIYSYVHPAFKDIIRATTLLVFLISFTSLWILGDTFVIFDKLFQSFYASLQVYIQFSKNIILGIMILFDILCHWVPVFYVGLPINISSIAIAYCILLCWYSVNVHRIEEIYTTGIYSDHSIYISTIFICIFTFCYYIKSIWL